jgi:hypothetical protein
MATDPDDGDDDEWRFSLEDLEEREDSVDSVDSVDAGSDATESADADDGTRDESGGGEGLDAGVAGRMDFSEELEAGEIDLENALFVGFGVLLALAFFAGFLNLFP